MSRTEEDTDFVPRCVSIPLGKCLGRVPEKSRDPFAATEPAEFWPVIHRAWRLATDTANAMVQELANRDVRRLPGVEKLPKWEPVDLYREWLNDKAVEPFRTAFAAFVGAKGSGSDICKFVREAWVRQRFDVLWKGEAWPLSYRYPYPWPVRRQEWKFRHSPKDGWQVSVTMPGGRYVYELRTGPDFRRQERDLHRIAAGEAKGGSLRLTPMRKDGHTVGVMMRLSGFFRPADKAGKNAALVRTDPAAFLVVEVAGRPPWILNADHLKRLTAAHRAYLQRTAEDLKREKRMDGRQRQHLNKSRGQRCEKHAARMDTALHQLSAQLVRFFVRQGAGVVVYDDHDKSYLPDGFPWFVFRGKVAHKLAEVGVPLVARDSADPEAYASWLADRSLVRATALAGKRLVAGVHRPGPHPAVTTPSAKGSTCRVRKIRSVSVSP